MSPSKPMLLICSGCHNNIEDEKIECCKCSSTYDLLCANITKEAFATLTPEFLSTWLCLGCRSKLPRGDNSDTPVRLVTRSVHSSDTTPVTASFPCSDNVTNFRGGAPRGRQPTEKIATDNIRDIIREELEKVIDNRLFKLINELFENHFKNCNLLQTVKLLSDRITAMDMKLESLTRAEIATNVRTKKTQASTKNQVCATTRKSKGQFDGSTFASFSQHMEPPTMDIPAPSSNYNSALTKNIATEITQLSDELQSASFLIDASPHVAQPDVTCQPQAEPRDSLPVPTTPVLKSNIADDGWTEVQRRRPRASLSSVLRGTAAPGTTKLEASERWRYLHLYYVKQGTSANQVREHLTNICGSDVCTVDVLKARGNYASFKLGVPSRLADKVMSAQNWAEDICVKPWRRTFRAKNDETQQTS